MTAAIVKLLLLLAADLGVAAINGMASIPAFCTGAGSLDTIDDLAADAFKGLHKSWAGSEVCLHAD